jgi:LysM repeat protein
MISSDKMPTPVVSRDLVETLDTAEELDLDQAALHHPSSADAISTLDAAPAIKPLDAAGQDYIVKKGDSLSAIAAKTGTTTERLAALNGISNPNRIRVGQRLVLGGDAKAPASAPVKSAPRKKVVRTLTGDSYTVQAGDSLSVIAAAFGVSVKDLKSVNNLKSDMIRKGQKLVIRKADKADAQPVEAPQKPEIFPVSTNEAQVVSEPPLIPEAPAPALQTAAPQPAVVE